MNANDLPDFPWEKEALWMDFERGYREYILATRPHTTEKEIEILLGFNRDAFDIAWPMADLAHLDISIKELRAAITERVSTVMKQISYRNMGISNLELVFITHGLDIPAEPKTSGIQTRRWRPNTSGPRSTISSRATDNKDSAVRLEAAWKEMEKKLRPTILQQAPKASEAEVELRLACMRDALEATWPIYLFWYNEDEKAQYNVLLACLYELIGEIAGRNRRIYKLECLLGAHGIDPSGLSGL